MPRASYLSVNLERTTASQEAMPKTKMKTKTGSKKMSSMKIHKGPREKPTVSGEPSPSSVGDRLDKETYLRRVRHALTFQDDERLDHEDYVDALSDLLLEIEGMREAGLVEAAEAAEAAEGSPSAGSP